MKKTVGLVENIVIIGKKRKTCEAKFDTGAYRTSIDICLAKELGLKKTGKDVLVKRASSTGIRRPLVKVKLKISNQTITTIANLSDRSHSTQKILVGRDIIFNNFIIDVEKSNKSPRASDLK